MTKNAMMATRRALEMMDVAARYIRQHCPDEEIHYDEADCDGSCVAADLESAAMMLKAEAIDVEPQP